MTGESEQLQGNSEQVKGNPEQEVASERELKETARQLRAHERQPRGCKSKCKPTQSKFKGATASKSKHMKLNIEDPTGPGDKQSDSVCEYECLLHAWGHNMGWGGKMQGSSSTSRHDACDSNHGCLCKFKHISPLQRGTHTHAGCASCHLFTRAVKPSWVLSRAPLCFMVASMCRNRWPMSASSWGSKRCC